MRDQHLGWLILALIVAAVLLPLQADGPKDNLPDNVRPIPPAGVEVPAADRRELNSGLELLEAFIKELSGELKSKPALLELLPDVQVYYKAVDWALGHNEFFNTKEIPVAKKLLEQGLERARLLREGKTPWTTATGLVVRGYVSKIDGSVQPYGLVVPASYQAGSPYRHRLDLWLHGRGETLSELNFIDGRQRSPGEFTPPHTFVLHPYGRYCNAFKFAGEIDVLEALAHAERHYPIDADRIVVRGFSMGGAGCWQLAVHYPGRWAAAAPGAGFAETADFLKVFQNEAVKPTGYEQKLWHMYDCTDYAINLFNCPTVAYSGEIDRQKQAADVMAAALAKQGIQLTHIIGPKTAHSYHPEAKMKINRRINSITSRGRDPVPKHVRVTTWTLRYPEAAWVRIEGLRQHWEQARMDVEIIGDQTILVETQNVSAFTLAMPAGHCPLNLTKKSSILIDRVVLPGPDILSDRSWTAHLRNADGGWKIVPSLDDGVLRKRPGLQGPMDDAFMDSFLMVRPTGQPWMNEKVTAWIAAEQKHAIEHWRKQFRGDARVKDDTAVTDADIANHNLILWGDPQSNQFLAKIADQLPIRWTAAGVQVGKQTFAADTHAPVLIYPNPKNPKRYIVLNSGFTFREYDYLNNARQVPKLPDWAVIDLRVPVSWRAPGGIAAAGFFDEQWKLRE